MATNKTINAEVIENADNVISQDDVENMTDEEIEQYVISQVDNDEIKNSADHPYILDLGGHVSYVGENILLEQMAFRKFKKAINFVIMSGKQDKKALQYWKSYGMLPDQMSAFEQAILKGVKLDYNEIAKEFNEMCEGKSFDFLAHFESLSQICQIKTIESKLLGIYDNEIQREKNNGEVSIYQSIVTATEFIYRMFATGLAEHTELMKEISFDSYFVNETKSWFRKKTSEYPKDILLEDYLELPKNLINKCLEVACEIGVSEKDLEMLCDSLEDLTMEFSNSNAETINMIRNQIENSNMLSNESMEYIRPTVDKEDLMYK